MSRRDSLLDESSNGPFLAAMTIPFLKELLHFASTDVTIDDAQLEAVTRSVVFVLIRRSLMDHFVPHLIHMEYRGDLNAWRERTGLMLLHSVAADCPSSFTYLARSCKVFLSQVSKSCTPRQLVAALTGLFVTLQKRMDTLPALQTYILQCVYSETERNSFGVAMMFFLRFVLPYLSHPRHPVHRPTLMLATKMISYVAGSQVADYETWPEELRALCTTWRARIISVEFFGGVLERKAGPFDTKETRRPIEEAKATLLTYTRAALPKLDNRIPDVAKMHDFV